VTRYGDVLEVSNSELQTFMDCGRRWWLTYYRSLRLKRGEAVVGPLSIGSRTHKALEEGYSTPGREEAMYKVLAQTIEEDYPKAVEAGVVDRFESECELVLIMLQGFAEWAAEEGLDAGWDVVSEERIVRSPTLRVGAQDVVLKGKLDQIIRRNLDDSLWMRDWKTTVYKEPVLIAFGPQIKMYRLLLSLTEPDAQVTGSQLVFLRKVKRSARAQPPFYMTEDIPVTRAEMEAFWRQLLGMLERLVYTTARLDEGWDHHGIVPPRQTRDCSWRCNYYAICDMFDDGSDVERMLGDLYERVDPYAYYDEDPDGTEETTEETKS
jgi:hypothetical protein